MRLMTFNLRYDHPGDRHNRWDNRRAGVCRHLRELAPDLVGLQEVTDRQRVELESELKDLYRFEGLGRNRDRRGEQTTLMARRDTVEILDWWTFWLSDEPLTPGTRTWKGLDPMVLPRIATMARVDTPLGRLLVQNAHFDHQSPSARALSARLLLRVAERMQGDDPLVIMGDLNAGEDEACIQLLSGRLRNAYRAVHPEGPACPTFHNFEGDACKNGCHIDYVFLDPRLGVADYRLFKEKIERRYPSDHYPVLVEVVG